MRKQTSPAQRRETDNMEKREEGVLMIYEGCSPVAVILKNDKVRTTTPYKLIEMTPEEVGDLLTRKTVLQVGVDNSDGQVTRVKL